MNQTNNLIIPYITCTPGPDMLAQASAGLDALSKQSISHALWLDVPQKPFAGFTMAYTRDAILLKYYVREKNLVAIHRRINEPVYKDSCVELFIGFENDLNYYNLEFNCAGTVLGQYGCGKAGRQFLNRERLELIRTEAAVRFNQQDELFEWELTIAIPSAVFEFHHITSFAGMTCRLNFFKCGDDLPEPHYLAWNAINTIEPNFHRPEYFGKGMFARSEILVEL